MATHYKSVIQVIGAGLAGSEAAWQIAQKGHPVVLWEMRPNKTTNAHVTGDFGELVCSNSLGSNLPNRASGMLKRELRLLGSLLIECADLTKVPAGGALAVGREAFSRLITRKIESHPLIEIIREEKADIPEGPVVIASGPLTSEPLSRAIQGLIGEDTFYFYDALAPIVKYETINMDVAFRGTRYDRGETQKGDYINCPLNEEEYNRFVHEITTAERIKLRDFETSDKRYFEGCLPIEVLASRGHNTLAFGPMRPVGLRDPRTNERPHAVVQLRQDDVAGTLYNLVGFQTNIKWSDQKRILQLVPGLEDAEFVRLGQMHRNSFINSPELLSSSLQLRKRPDVFFAGQISGIEGYVGNIASGLLAGLNVVRFIQEKALLDFPNGTMLGSLTHYISEASPKNFQPMKANFGLLPPLIPKVKGKRERYQAYSDRGDFLLKEFIAENAL